MSEHSSSVTRSLTPGNSSSSISTQSETHSEATRSSENVRPAGRFDAGMPKPEPEGAAGRLPTASARNADPVAAAAPASTAAVHQRPSCPLPALMLIRTLAVVGGGAGLFSTIYGGLGLMKATDPALDPERGKHAALMITGLVELVIALVAGMLTQDCSGSGTNADHPPA